ncbi:MAG: hypothetical protein MZV64_33900 [Ignavibacteriales bacterium]|nr:hypothetical protein [Ignavibacteriales bacterium]
MAATAVGPAWSGEAKPRKSTYPMFPASRSTLRKPKLFRRDSRSRRSRTLFASSSLWPMRRRMSSACAGLNAKPMCPSLLTSDSVFETAWANAGAASSLSKSPFLSRVRSASSIFLAVSAKIYSLLRSDEISSTTACFLAASSVGAFASWPRAKEAQTARTATMMTTQRIILDISSLLGRSRDQRDFTRARIPPILSASGLAPLSQLPMRGDDVAAVDVDVELGVDASRTRRCGRRPCRPGSGRPRIRSRSSHP